MDVVERGILEDDEPGGISMFALMNSRTEPRAELKTSRSTRPRWTSSKRLTA